MMGMVSIKFEELYGWQFKIDEISAGVYKVSGIDKSGRSVEVTGIDPELLLIECKKYAKWEIDKK
jgi:hypothetical protein